MNDRKRLVTITTTCYNLHDINLLIVRGMYQNIFLLTVIFAKLFPQKLQHSKSLSLKRLRANWWICTRHSKLACKGHNMYTNQLNINTLPRVKIGWEFVGVNRRQCPNTVHTSIESFFNLIVIVHAIVWMNHNGLRCPNSVFLLQVLRISKLDFMGKYMLCYWLVRCLSIFDSKQCIHITRKSYRRLSI